ncbi:MAG: cell division topological specificity factor MinE [Lysobacterales bacterium CG02_land_8_20_14_3_00_62_12]|nr:MAG: cell division topological specificity factor MinE [Xanthomonadales bacterium CG02_land_8_20_14_3_00_62_12]
MGIFDFLKPRPAASAHTAKERLRIIIAQERLQRGAPDYLPMLRREILEVLRKYVNVDPDAIQVKLCSEGDHELLELSVALPESRGQRTEDGGLKTED